MKEIASALRNDGFDVYRVGLFDEVRSRFGPAAAEDLETRLLFAAGKTLVAWARRATFMLSYPELLEPVPLAVEIISPALLLKYAFGAASQKESVLLRFARSGVHGADRLLLRERAPWLLDLRNFDRAVALLRLRGWLLLACEESGQADLLVRATLESKRLSVSLIVPATIAGESETDIEHRHLRPLPWDFAKCLR